MEFKTRLKILFTPSAQLPENMEEFADFRTLKLMNTLKCKAALGERDRMAAELKEEWELVDDLVKSIKQFGDDDLNKHVDVILEAHRHSSYHRHYGDDDPED